MRKDMDGYHERNSTFKLPKRSKCLYPYIHLVIIICLSIPLESATQKQEPDRIEEVSYLFLETWLTKGDVKAALSFIADKPVMGSCLSSKKEGLSWRNTRQGVIDKLSPAFAKLADGSGAEPSLENVIACEERKLEFPRVSHRGEKLFDLYPVGPRLLTAIMDYICSGKDKTDFFEKGVRNYHELYLMRFHFKEGLEVIVLWAREDYKLRIISLDFN
jgi:hypothetical protein